MFRIALLFLPSLICFVVALAACLPWGAPLPVQFALPLLTMAVIFFWSVKRPDQLPSLIVFLIGLFTDLATAGPMGYWPLIFLLAAVIAGYGRERLALGGDLIATTILYSVAVCAVSFVGWSLSSLFFLRAMPVRPLIEGGAIAIVAYPVIAYLLLPVNRVVGQAVQAGGFRGSDGT